MSGPQLLLPSSLSHSLPPPLRPLAAVPSHWLPSLSLLPSRCAFTCSLLISPTLCTCTGCVGKEDTAREAAVHAHTPTAHSQLLELQTDSQHLIRMWFCFPKWSSRSCLLSVFDTGPSENKFQYRSFLQPWIASKWNLLTSNCFDYYYYVTSLSLSRRCNSWPLLK